MYLCMPLCVHVSMCTCVCVLCEYIHACLYVVSVSICVHVPGNPEDFWPQLSCVCVTPGKCGNSSWPVVWAEMGGVTFSVPSEL